MWRGCVSAGMSVHILTDLREFFFKGGRTGLRCIHVLRVPGSFTHQVSWCARHSQCLYFLLTLTGADAVRPELPGIPAARAAP